MPGLAGPSETTEGNQLRVLQFLKETVKAQIVNMKKIMCPLKFARVNELVMLVEIPTIE